MSQHKNDATSLMEEYKDVFKGLGRMPGEDQDKY